ncbi:hypothetical protein M501DRAFT_992944 [Patellaria atrata CBS 101060]|uniref:Uncharacterized protein n=1 Tax=Patellaria atrata CBS 101060 TaxID=1346257 RepID=A0A9P4S8L5_9PEZI|nr:hypothetical protein M501DRAFT_992944 [Patellaria atrata CBS 101060]
MMVPRSFMFRPHTVRAEEHNEKNDMSIRTRPPSGTRIRTPVKPTQATQPVVIPTRTQSSPSTTKSTQTLNVRGQRAARTSQKQDAHNPRAVPPAVAALLAVTSIPPPRTNTTRRTISSSRRLSIEELVQEWRAEAKESASAGYGSPLDILLEGQENCEFDTTSLCEDCDVESMSTVSSRSKSSDSIPSLESDNQSILSNSSIPTPPSTIRRSTGDRKDRIVKPPPTEDCIYNHPLLSFQNDIDDLPTEIPVSTLPRKQARRNSKSSFKSNLTASLKALKSAAKSFSNFTAPTIPPEDLLTRSLLFPGFTSEMRPRPLSGPPDAALRRYLNPTTPLTTTELGVQLHGYDRLREECQDCPMIQMQTYDAKTIRQRKRRTRSLATAPQPVSKPQQDVPEPPKQTTVRQREPRENADFLRVIVLEMNMRRMGKLDARAMGRARLWLPPRTAEKVESDSGSEGEEDAAPEKGRRKVPGRWRGVSVEDFD